MCRPQGNTNQDYEISLQNIKKDIIYKNPEKSKNPEHKVLIRMWRNKKPVCFWWGCVIPQLLWQTVLQFTKKTECRVLI